MEIDISRLKRVVNSLPDDARVLVEVTRNYGNRKNRSNEEVYGFLKMGKVLVLQCTTSV